MSCSTVRADDPPDPLPVPPVLVPGQRGRVGDLRAGTAAAAAASDHHQRRGLPGRQKRLPGTCRAKLLGARMTSTKGRLEIPKPLAEQAGGLDDRFHAAKGVRTFMRKVFPD